MDTIFYRGDFVVARVAGEKSLDWLELDDVAGYRVEHVLTADDVRAEASRRMQALVGARDAAHLEIIVANGSREAIRLLRKGQDNWTPEEAARAAELEAVDTAIEAIRACSNAIEADPPADFADEKWWPL